MFVPYIWRIQYGCFGTHRTNLFFHGCMMGSQSIPTFSQSRLLGFSIGLMTRSNLFWQENRIYNIQHAPHKRCTCPWTIAQYYVVTQQETFGILEIIPAFFQDTERFVHSENAGALQGSNVTKEPSTSYSGLLHSIHSLSSKVQNTLKVSKIRIYVLNTNGSEPWENMIQEITSLFKLQWV